MVETYWAQFKRRDFKRNPKHEAADSLPIPNLTHKHGKGKV
jgi:hypothetical protein